MSNDSEKQLNVSEISAEDNKMIRELIPEWHREVSQHLSELPAEFEIEIANVPEYIVSEMGVGGTAYTKSKIGLWFNPTFKDKEAQLRDLKGTYFHEAYHTARDFTLDSSANQSPIDRAIEEGLAEVFEREVSGSGTIVGDYSNNNDIDKWVLEIISISSEEFVKNWHKYIIYDAETDRRWINYAVGKYIVDRALANNKEVTIVDLVSYDCSEILKMAALDNDQYL